MAKWSPSHIAFLVMVIGIAGCSSQPAAVKPADVDPDSAAAKAIEIYDKDGDGALAGAELEAVPGIRKHTEKYDKDGDGSVSESEIRDRIALWREQGLGLKLLSVVVTLDGQPLADATVTFEPEPYLGEAVYVATGTTGPRGSTRIRIDEKHLPEQLQGQGRSFVTGGTFKIRVTHPTAKIPAKFNEQTNVGEEIANDTVRDSITVAVTSR